MEDKLNDVYMEHLLHYMIDSDTIHYHIFSTLIANSLFRLNKTNKLQYLIKADKIKKLYNEKPYWILPLLVGLDELDPSKIDYEENETIKHWMLCIIQPARGLIEIYDPLNRLIHMNYWGTIIKNWLLMNLNSVINDNGINLMIKRFSGSPKIIHQSSSLNCGYFCCFYLYLFKSGYNLNEIEIHPDCNEKALESFKNIIKKNTTIIK